jgi:hypothetical protein
MPPMPAAPKTSLPSGDLADRRRPRGQRKHVRGAIFCEEDTGRRMATPALRWPFGWLWRRHLLPGPGHDGAERDSGQT